MALLKLLSPILIIVIILLVSIPPKKQPALKGNAIQGTAFIADNHRSDMVVDSLHIKGLGKIYLASMGSNRLCPFDAIHDTQPSTATILQELNNQLALSANDSNQRTKDGISIYYRPR